MREYLGRIIHRAEPNSGGIRWHVMGIGRADSLAGIKRLVREYLQPATGTAFLHFGIGNEPRQTIRVPLRETDRPQWGLTATGYGNKIPSVYMVQWEGRWRRVYVCQYGNVGTAYIGKPGAWLATVGESD